MSWQGLRLPQGDSSRGKRALDIDEPLVAGTAKTQRDIAFGLDKGTVHKNIKFADNVKQRTVLLNLLPRV